MDLCNVDIDLERRNAVQTNGKRIESRISILVVSIAKYIHIASAKCQLRMHHYFLFIQHIPILLLHEEKTFHQLKNTIYYAWVHRKQAMQKVFNTIGLQEWIWKQKIIINTFSASLLLVIASGVVRIVTFFSPFLSLYLSPFLLFFLFVSRWPEQLLYCVYKCLNDLNICLASSSVLKPVKTVGFLFSICFYL